MGCRKRSYLSLACPAQLSLSLLLLVLSEQIKWGEMRCSIKIMPLLLPLLLQTRLRFYLQCAEYRMKQNVLNHHNSIVFLLHSASEPTSAHSPKHPVTKLSQYTQITWQSNNDVKVRHSPQTRCQSRHFTPLTADPILRKFVKIT